jgi:uncharacterized phage-like protein YoqJ
MIYTQDGKPFEKDLIVYWKSECPKTINGIKVSQVTEDGALFFDGDEEIWIPEEWAFADQKLAINDYVSRLNKKVAVTGHRPDKLNNEYDGVGPVSDNIRKKISEILLQEKPDLVISGMALGVDMIFAEVALDLKIPVLAAIPCNGQEKIWKTHQQKRYNDILNNSLTVKHIVTDGGYAGWKMIARNKYMVDRLGEKDILISFWDGTPGGTAQCTDYAKKANKRVITVNPNELK